MNFAKFAAFLVVAVGVNSSAFASCGDSFYAMAAGPAAVGQPNRAQPDAQTSGKSVANTSIVGLWHVRFEVGGQIIQEAYQLWNLGGTEIHNPNVDPRSGDVCLGVWEQAGKTYKLSHRVWIYDTNGNFLGTIHLFERLSLSNDGNSQKGAFLSNFYDPTGKFVSSTPGNVVGERVSVE